MKHGSNTRRGRGRGNGKRHTNPQNRTYESNGPDVKVRGTAQQVLEKYLVLARDASSSGDRIAAESYLQFAEHYYRVLTANQQQAQANQQAQQGQQGQQGGNGGQQQKPGPGDIALADEPPTVDTGETDFEPAESSQEDAAKPAQAKPRRRTRKPASEAANTEDQPEAASA